MRVLHWLVKQADLARMLEDAHRAIALEQKKNRRLQARLDERGGANVIPLRRGSA